MEHFVELYNPEMHNAQLTAWLEGWGLNPEIVNDLSTTGFIIENQCAAFIYETNSPVCYLDGFLSNKTTYECRNECLNQVIQTAINHAKSKGFKKIVAETLLPSVIERALQFEFESLGFYTVLSKRL